MTVKDSWVLFEGVHVDFEGVGTAVIQGQIFLDSLHAGGHFTLDSGGYLQASYVDTVASSSMIFQSGSTAKTTVFSSLGGLTLKTNCNFEFTKLLIAMLSNVSFESQFGAIIPRASSVALSGALLASRLVIHGSLQIPAFSNVFINIPVLATELSECKIEVNGQFTVDSYFSLNACDVFGSGKLVILKGFASDKVVVVSVQEISISRMFNVSLGSRVHFQNSTIRLLSCTTNIYGSLLAFASSYFVLFHDSLMTIQNGSISGFRIMTCFGATTLRNSSIQAFEIVFPTQSVTVCETSTIFAGIVTTAGMIFICLHYKS